MARVLRVLDVPVCAIENSTANAAIATTIRTIVSLRMMIFRALGLVMPVNITLRMLEKEKLMKRNLVAVILLLGCLAINAQGQEPAWDASKIEPCDRSCLTGVMDRYLETVIKK